MSHSYYVNDGKETTGPFPVADLQARLATGTLPPGALLHNGLALRLPLKKCRDFSSAFCYTGEDASGTADQTNA